MSFKIDCFDFTKEQGVFIIAELSANHNGSLEHAIETIRAAKRSGADAIKLQTYTADTITLNVRSDDFKITQGTIWDGNYLYDLYEKAYTPWEWHEKLFKVARDEGIICFSSPFDNSAVDLLERLNSPAYKIASLEITDIPLIEYVASKGKPVIISTGIADQNDIKLAIQACEKMGNSNIALLKCTTAYPAPIEDANLAMISDLSSQYKLLTGLSDHTLGITAPIVATCLGARIIEKHFILDKAIGGPDASFSLDEAEFTMMVGSVREAEKAIGKIDYSLSEKQLKSREFSRSLYVVKEMKKGDIITAKNVKSIRPGFGLHPKYFESILGQRVNKDLEIGERFELKLID